MDSLLIQISILETISIIVGVSAAIIAGSWYLSHRLTKVETEVKGFEKRFINLEGRLDNAFSSASPISLKESGKKALEASGLKEWIHEHQERLLTSCAELDNPYDVQEASFQLFDEMGFGDLEGKLKQTAFNNGWNMSTMRRIGGIYFRDICLENKGFKPEDLD